MRHSARVRAGRAAGFANLSVDLIFGWPNQTLDVMVRDLEAMAATGVTHITHYELNVAGRNIFNSELDSIAHFISTQAVFPQIHLLGVRRFGIRSLIFRPACCV